MKSVSATEHNNTNHFINGIQNEEDAIPILQDHSIVT